MKALDESILETIYENNYKLYIGGLGNAATAYANASQVFTRSDTPRKVWNALVLQRPCFCGKIHESIGSEITVGQCTKQDNPLCGHPEETQFFHGIGVASYLAGQIDKSLPHASVILSALTSTDFAAQVSYGTDIFSTLCGNPGGAIELLEEGEIDEQTAYELTGGIPANISTVRKTLQARERRLWEEVIRPHMMRVSDILRAA